MRWIGHLNDGGGEFETPFVVVGRRRGDRFHLMEWFEADDDAAWCRGLAKLLGERGDAADWLARLIDRYDARDWDGLRALFTSDAIIADRRPLGAGELRGPEPYVEFLRGMVELAPDARVRVVRVLDLAPHLCLIRLDVRGHAARGGEIEVPHVDVVNFRDGLNDHVEMFDPGDEAQALERRPGAQGIQVAHSDLAPLGFDPAELAQGVQGRRQPRSRGRRPTRELLLADREADRHPVAGRLAVALDELDQPGADPTDGVGRPEIDPLSGRRRGSGASASRAAQERDGGGAPAGRRRARQDRGSRAPPPSRRRRRS